MAREYFKDLPNTTTPLRSSRINGLLNGEESIEKIVAGSVEGKNLININDISVGVLISAEGVTSTSANWNLANEYIKVKPSSKLTFSCKTSQSYMQFRIYEYDNNKGWVQRQETNNVNSWTVTLSTTTSYVRAGYLNNKNATNIQLEIGEQVTDYVPYMKYGYNSEKSMGNIVVDDIQCKNLLPLTNKSDTINGVTYTWEGTKLTLNGTASANTNIYNVGSWGNTNKFFELKNGTYTSSVTGANNINRFGMYMLGGNDGTVYILNQGNDVSTKTITLDSTKNVNSFYISIKNGTVFNNETFYLQLEKGSEATSYTSYKEFDSTPITKIWSGSVYNQNDTMTLSKKLEVNKLYMIRYFDNSSYYYGSHLFLYLGGTAQNESLAQINFYNYDDGTRTRYRLKYDGNLTLSVQLANNGASNRAITDIYEIK